MPHAGLSGMGHWLVKLAFRLDQRAGDGVSQVNPANDKTYSPARQACRDLDFAGNERRSSYQDLFMKNCRFICVLVACLMAAVAMAATAPGEQPKIVVILTDDQGYADISLNPHHPKEVSTPHMDALASAGVAFSQGYASGHVCSPTRAGLMLGGYSQRVGVYTAGDGGRGFDPKKTIFPGFLPDEYVSTAIGKWHLGLDDDYPELKWHAVNRGFDECYKFMGRGGHSYFNLRSDGPDRVISGPALRSDGTHASPDHRMKSDIPGNCPRERRD